VLVDVGVWVAGIQPGHVLGDHLPLPLRRHVRGHRVTLPLSLSFSLTHTQPNPLSLSHTHPSTHPLAHSLRNNSKWNWTDETEVDYTPWAPGQPTFNREPGEIANASSTMVAFTAPNGEGWDDGNVYGADEDDSPAVCLKVLNHDPSTLNSEPCILNPEP